MYIYIFNKTGIRLSLQSFMKTKPTIILVPAHWDKLSNIRYSG